MHLRRPSARTSVPPPGPSVPAFSPLPATEASRRARVHRLAAMRYRYCLFLCVLGPRHVHAAPRPPLIPRLAPSFARPHARCLLCTSPRALSAPARAGTKATHTRPAPGSARPHANSPIHASKSVSPAPNIVLPHVFSSSLGPHVSVRALQAHARRADDLLRINRERSRSWAPIRRFLTSRPATRVRACPNLPLAASCSRSARTLRAWVPEPLSSVARQGVPVL